MKVLRVLCPNLTDDPGFLLDCSFGIVGVLVHFSKDIAAGLMENAAAANSEREQD